MKLRRSEPRFKKQDATQRTQQSTKMDPVAVFHHQDLHCESIGQRNWQKLNADRVSSCQFNSTGRYAAVYCNWTTVEIWDTSSIPVPTSCLLLPRSLANRLDGYCHALVWSVCGTRITGVFGARPAFKRKALVGADQDTATVYEGCKASYILVWDIIDRKILHNYRLPFPVSAMMPLPVRSSSASTSARTSFYVVTSATNECVFLLNTDNGSIRAVPGYCPADGTWHLCDVTSSDNTRTDVFAQWWVDQYSSYGPSSTVTCEDSTVYVASPPKLRSAASTDTNSTVSRITVRLGENDDVHFSTVTRCTLSTAGRVVSLAIDFTLQLLVVTTENCATSIFTTANGTLKLVAEHQPSDRYLVDFLNAQSSGLHMRSAAKFHSGAAHRKLNTVTYGATASFKCTYSAFYREFVPHGVNNTRYTNSLRPFELLPLEPTLTSSNKNGHCNGSSSAPAPVAAALSASQQQLGGERCKVSIVYCIQSVQRGANQGSGPAPGSLIQWEFELPQTLLEQTPIKDEQNGVSGTSYSPGPGAMKVVALPPGEIAQIAVAPFTTLSGQMHAGKDCAAMRATRQPPRQTLLCIDAAGALHMLRAQYRTDFPGAMYPIGYTLITKVIGYLEQEDELDTVAGSSAAGKGSSSNLAVRHHASASASGSGGAASLNGSSSGRSSVESLLGLNLLEETENGTHMAVKADPSTFVPIQEGAKVTSLVLTGPPPHSSSHSADTDKARVLPFTFADDWLRFPASATRAASTSAGSTAHPSSHASTHMKGAALTSPQRGSTLTSLVGLHSPVPVPGADMMDVAEDERSTTGAGSSASTEAFTGGFETFLAVPAKVQNGDFDAKLQRQRAAAETLRGAMLEPQRAVEKMRQLQEEAIAAVYHAAELQEKKRQKSALAKAEREKTKLQQQQQQLLANQAALAAAAALQAQQSEEQRVLAALGYVGHSAQGPSAL